MSRIVLILMTNLCNSSLHPPLLLRRLLLLHSHDVNVLLSCGHILLQNLVKHDEEGNYEDDEEGNPNADNDLICSFSSLPAHLHPDPALPVSLDPLEALSENIAVTMICNMQTQGWIFRWKIFKLMSWVDFK